MWPGRETDATLVRRMEVATKDDAKDQGWEYHQAGIGVRGLRIYNALLGF